MDSQIVVAGTRPEIIKVAPVIREILKRKLDLYFVLTGQHYDYLLSEQIIEDLNLPQPNKSFKLKTSSPASQIAEIMTNLEPSLKKRKGSIIIIQGDTNSVLATALTAVKLHIPIAHVESGLRSYDWRMPEEHNRRMVDHISNLLFAPTKESKENLLTEGIYGKIYVTGNTVMDAVTQHMPLAEKASAIIQQIIFSEYILATIHRSENVDHPTVLRNIVQGLIESKLPIIIPLHPRSRKRLQEYGLLSRLSSAKNIQLLPPVGYLDFLLLMRNSKFIVTDSGGIQEEATSKLISKRVLVLRNSTERPEALDSRFTRLVKLESRKLSKEMLVEWETRPKKKQPTSPYGNGNSSVKILDFISKYQLHK